MKTLIAVALTSLAIASTGTVAAFAGPDNSIMVHGYQGTAYGK